MKTFLWNECFITGIETIDGQHLHLVELINGLSDRLAGNRQPDLAELDKLIDELTDYTQYHFAEEEQYMARMGCDERFQAEHLRKHADFIAHVGTLHKDAHYAPERFADTAVHYLISWLAYHILGVDQSMARQVQRIQTGMSPAQAYEQDKEMGDQSIAVLLDALVRLSEISANRAIALSDTNEKLRQAKLELEKQSRDMATMLSAVHDRLDHLASLDPGAQAAELAALRRDIAGILGAIR